MNVPSRKSLQRPFATAFVLIIIFSLVVYLNAVVAVQLFSIPSSGIVGLAGRTLHIDGKYTKNDLGNIVYLRGVNRGHFEEDPGGQWGTISGGKYGSGNYDHDQMVYELNFMAANGINVLRLYERVQFWIDDTAASVVSKGSTTWDGVTTMTHRQIVKDIIAYAAKEGIYVVYVPWTLDSSSQLTGKLPHQTPYLSEDGFVNYWLNVVAELGVYDNVLWEFWNEPYGGAGTEWQRVWQRLITAIQSTGDYHIIVVSLGSQFGAYPQYTGPLNWVWDYPFNGTNLLYSSHLYWYQPGSNGDSFSLSDGSRAYTYDVVKGCITTGGMEALGYPKQNSQPWKLLAGNGTDSVLGDNKAFWVGEIGPFMGLSGDQYTQEMQWWTNVLKILNELGVGYAGWDWQMGAGWRLVDSQWIRSGPIQLSEAGQTLVNAINTG